MTLGEHGGGEKNTSTIRGILKMGPNNHTDLYDTLQVGYETSKEDLGMLEIKFYRAARSTRDDGRTPRPPGHGCFPIYPAFHFNNSFSPNVVASGDCIVPMYQREAMWVHLRSTSQFAVKIFRRGQNFFPGTYDAKGRYQDYLFIPSPKTVESIVTPSGSWKEITASPTATGYLFNSPVASLQDTEDLEFEIIPYRKPLWKISWAICHPVSNKLYRIQAGRPNDAIEPVFQSFCEMMDLPRGMTSFILDGERIDAIGTNSYSWHSLMCCEVGIVEGSIVFARDNTANPLQRQDKAQCGISRDAEKYRHPFRSEKLNWGAPDNLQASGWDIKNTFFVKVHLLNVTTFKAITGLEPPPTLITKEVYAQLPRPFLDIYEEALVDDEDTSYRISGRTQEAGHIALVGTKGTKERRTFVSRNQKPKLAESGVSGKAVQSGKAGEEVDGQAKVKDRLEVKLEERFEDKVC